MKRFFLLTAAFLLLFMNVRADEPADNQVNLTGSGTNADPWQVKSAADVLEICKWTNNVDYQAHFAGKYFKLMNDIDMSTVKTTEFWGIGAAPLNVAAGTLYYFGGTFDGDGHRIKNMTINPCYFNETTGKVIASAANTTRQYTGFFGIVHGGAIRNLIIDSSCKITGYQYVGGICGRAAQSTVISNCVNEADIYCYYQYSGGIVGYSYGTSSSPGGTITNCANYGNVYGAGAYAGGIAGYGNYSTFRGCSNYGNITGGFFDNRSNAVKNSQTYVGGIFGVATGPVVSNVLNAGNISSSADYCGGLFGHILGTSSVTVSVSNALNTGHVYNTESLRHGIIAGVNGNANNGNYAATFTNVYYDSQMNALSGKVAGQGETTGAVGKTTSELTSGTALTGLSTTDWTFTSKFYPMLSSCKDNANAKFGAAAYITLGSGITNANFSGTGTVSSALTGMTFKSASDLIKINGSSVTIGTSAFAVDTIKVTQGNYSTTIPMRVIPASIWEGAGTSASPYLIKNANDLVALQNAIDWLGNWYKGTYFKMTNDIDLTGNTEFSGLACRSGYATGNEPYVTHRFAGSFDGGGYTIKGMNIRRLIMNGSTIVTAANGSSVCVGFVGSLDSTGVVKNINFDETSYMEAYGYIGGVAGYVFSGATIENCSYRGMVYSPLEYAGSGLYYYVGGIAAYTQPSFVATDSTTNKYPVTFKTTIKDCYFGGTVSHKGNYTGGIVGANAGALVTGCVNAGYVYGNMYCGGICGTSNGAIMDCANFGTVARNSSYVGGIVGQVSPANLGGVIQRVVNGGMVMVSAAASTGDIYGSETINAALVKYAQIKNLYTDTQLSFSRRMVGTGGIKSSSGVVFVDSASLHAMQTVDLTNGVAIDSLASTFHFEKGYYPIPKGLANNQYVRAAAAVFITLGEGQTLNEIRTAAPINEVVPVTARLVNGNVFKIVNDTLTFINSDEVAIDTLILTTGNFVKKYPMTKMTGFLEGSGSATDPWKVRTVADMNKIADYSTVAKTGYTGEYFQLMNDIDFEGQANKPIGTSYRFGGYFDGQNYTIKNITNLSNDTANKIYVGVFAYTNKGSIIKNLRLSNIKFSGGNSVGTLCGHSWSTIDNIYTDDKCSVSGYFTDPDSYQSNGSEIGGIVGYLTRGATITNCENHATVTGYKYVGGIVGYSQDSADSTYCKLENNVNYAPVTSLVTMEQVASTLGTLDDHVDAFVGGIAGNWGGLMKNCINYGDVTAFEGYNVGGLAGYSAPGTYFEDSYNYGTVSANSYYVGGMVGYIPALTYGSDLVLTFNNSGNYADVTGYNFVGGLVGQSATLASYSNTFNLGNVTANHSYAGGLIGVMRGAERYATYTSTVEYCYNTGNVTAPLRVAGLVAFAENYGTFTVSRSFNVGNVIETEKADSAISVAAGIANGAINVQTCYNVGNVKGWNNVGGLMGVINQPSTGVTPRLMMSYNLGEVSTSRTAAGTKIGNITPNTTYIVSGCYALDNVQHFADDEKVGVNFVTPIELTQANLGAAFVRNELCFPMLKDLDNLDVAKAYAAYFDGTTDADGCYNADINLAQLEGVNWTSNHLLTIDGDVAKTVAAGVGELTANCGDYSKTYYIKVDTYNSVDQLFNDLDEVVEKQFFTIDGVRLAEPRVGEINVVIYITKDGKKEVKKVYIK